MDRSPVKAGLFLRQQVWMLLGVSLSILWGAVAWDLHMSEQSLLTQLRQQTSALNLALAEHTEFSLRLADHALRELRRNWLNQPSDFTAASSEYQRLMGDMTLQVHIVDARGTLVYGDLSTLEGTGVAAADPYFEQHHAARTEELTLRAPGRGLLLQAKTLQLMRPLYRQGRFQGAVVLSLDPQYFVRLYENLDLGAHRIVALVTDSSHLVVRSVGNERVTGGMAPEMPFLQAGAPLAGQFRRVSSFDGRDRIVSYKRLPDYQLSVLVGASVADQRDSLRQQNLTILCIAAGVTLVLVLVSRRMLQNIVRRVVVESALRESEDRYRSLVEYASVGIAVHQEGKLVYVNPTAVRLLAARSAQELLGIPILRFVHPEFRHLVVERVTSSMQRGQAMPLQEEKFIRLDGVTVDIEIQGNVIRYQGAPAVQVTFQDISERKQSHARLLLAASVFTHAREAIMITDTQGTIVEVNDTFSRITGYSYQEAVGQNPRILKSGRQPPEHYATMWKTLKEQGHWSGEVWNRRKDGEVYAEMQTVSAVVDAAGCTRNYLALFTDITAMKQQQRQLERIAHFDALTGLPNRVLLADRLQQAMLQTLRRKRALAVCYLDLDGFKAVNDTHGHATGDELLVQLAHRMRAALREGDTLARMGGDEFIAILGDLSHAAECEPMLERLLQAAAQPVPVGDLVLQVSASMGVTLYPQDDAEAELLMRHADQAMYAAKQAGKNRYHLFDVAQDEAIKVHHESVERIQQALNHGELVLYYQPKVHMPSGRVVGAEALIRWQHPERGLLAPAAFLPLIENHAVSIALGEWVIADALRQMALWSAAGLQLPVSVNIGASQLQQGDFASRLQALLAAQPAQTQSWLELEILETSALDDLAAVAHLMSACKSQGVEFALDDFGTGYSSLTYLRRLPVQTIKIDQSFVRDMLEDPDDLAIVQGVVGLAAAFGRQVIAEGVESVEHGTRLLQLGCALAQGYGIARPMPAADLAAWVTRWRPDAAWAAFNRPR